MENRAHAFAAGLFALLLIAAAVLSVWWFGGKREATRDYLVVTRQNVSGLSLQAQVRYRGIRVGRVEAIRLDPEDGRNILIRISVGEEIPITRGTIAKLGQQGLTGIAHVLLEETGKDMTPLATDKDPARIPMQPSLIEELSEAGSATLQQARELLGNANQLLNKENRERMSKTLANLEASTAGLAATLNETKTLLADDRVKRLGPAIVSVQGAADTVKVFFGEARVLVPRFTALSEKLEAMVGETNGEGAAAAAPRVQEVARELAQTTRQLNRVLLMLQDAPQSVLYGPPMPVPGPGEPGFVPPASMVKP